MKNSGLLTVFWRHLILAAFYADLLLLAACQTSPGYSPPSVPADSRPSPRSATAQATCYAIRSDLSEVRFLVFRAGPLANFGHNHVIQAKKIMGEIHLANEFQQSHFWLAIPVADLQVDAAEARAVEGADFAKLPDAEAIFGTTRNMLGDKVLNAALYPQIVIRSSSLAGPAGAPDATVRIKLRDVERDLAIPVSVAYRDDLIVATAVFEISQKDFGITPLSVLGGAIQVADVVKVRIRIVAQKG